MGIRFLSAGLALTMATSGSPALASDVSLVMVEQRGCAYCAAWNDEIAPAYPNTAEGRYAPLLRADLRQAPPDGMSYARSVTFTPTFILMEDGQEIARMEGYVGQDFFWPVFSRLLETHTDFEPTPNDQ